MLLNRAKNKAEDGAIEVSSHYNLSDSFDRSYFYIWSASVQKTRGQFSFMFNYLLFPAGLVNVSNNLTKKNSLQREHL